MGKLFGEGACPSGPIFFFQPSETVLIKPEGEPITIQLELIDPRPNVEYGTKLVGQILDADDEEILGSEEVQLKIPISDW